MEKEINRLKELIENSPKILITSHVSPDPDSICSILLLGTTLEANYPDKQIIMHSEELPENIDFLPGYHKIKKQPLVEAIDEVELIIIVDAMNFARCSRKDFEQISQTVKEKNIPVAIIDHHEPVDIEENAVYINQGYPAAVEQVYEVCFKALACKKPEGWAEITMVGLYSDTAGFTYLNDNFQDTLDLASELISVGMRVEYIKNKLNQYKLEDIKAIGEVLANTKVENGYTYSYIGDEFMREWLESGKSEAALQIGIKFFTDQFARNVEGNKWGFAVYKDLLAGDGVYSVSFRSLNGVKDVAGLARKFNGGGHKGAAGAKLQASSVEEAIKIVKSNIVS